MDPGSLLHDLFPGADLTSAALRATDWSSTPAGPAGTWPPALLAAVRTALPSRVPMMIWWGPELMQLYNQAMTPLLGSKHPGAIGGPAAGSYPEAWDELGPLAASVLAGDGATYSRDLFLPYERHGYVEETYWTFSYSPIGADGLVGGVLVACLDTTGRVLAERRLRLLQQLGSVSAVEARTTAEACQEVMAVIERGRADVPFALVHLLSDGGRSLRLAAAFGVDEGTVRDWTFIPGPDDDVPSWRVITSGSASLEADLYERFGAVFQPSVLGPAVPDRAMILPLSDGSTNQRCGALVLGLSPYREVDEEHRGFLELVALQVSRGVSDAAAYQAERHRAEALAELDRAKTEFLENVSHELRTPLTLVLGPLRAVLADAGLAGTHRDAVEGARRAALRLQRLVDTLLEVATAEAERLRAVLEPSDAGTLTAECAAMFRPAIERAGLRFVVDAPPLDEPVGLDPEMWTKIVSNLLSNALKSTATGAIVVRVASTAEDVRLEVIDTGVGIPADEVPRIFRRFYRVPGSVVRSQEGMGIGLALVADLVLAHHGDVAVDSTPGAGTTFTVTVPRRHAVARAIPRASVQEVAGGYVADAQAWVGDAPTPHVVTPRADAVGGSVLLVEDNADMRAYLTRLLRGDGWEVTAVSDVESARACPRPDLLLSDVMLAGSSGLELVQAIRRDAEWARVPVILLTARAGPESAAEGLAAGADDYVVKPFDADELLARVRVHLELARLREYALSQAEDRAANLQQALISNRAIGAAMGILMSRHDLDQASAFALLRQASQHRHVKLRDLADEVLATGDLPEPDGPNHAPA